MSLAGLGLALAWLFVATPGGADTPRQADAPPPQELSLEVQALQTLHYLKATPAQLRALREMAKETVGKPPPRAEVKASAEFRKALAELRDALASGDEEEHIDELTEKLDDLREDEKPELHDEFDVTEEAQRRAPEALRLLTARQVADFAAVNGEDLHDPRELLANALDEVRGMKADEYKEWRQAVAEEVGRLVAGLDDDKASRVTDQVVQWLIVARSLKDDEFKARRADLEKQARAIVGELGPTDVLRHFLETNLAELLSNPRLPAALAARLK
jgi:hypothetical protein